MSELFKKLSLIDRYLESLSPEAREEYLSRKKLIEDNEFYKGETLSDVEDKDGEVIRYDTRNVLVYRNVNRENVVDDKVLISFGGYCEYRLDRRFIDLTRERLIASDKVKFCIDIGMRESITNSEMLRILDEVEVALTEKGITLEEDESKKFRESDMGKMVSGLGFQL